MADSYIKQQSWRHKFRHAFRGAKRGVRGQSSFFVHFFVAALVILAAAVLSVTQIEWCLLLFCITVVLTAEMLNTAIEHLAKAVNPAENPHVGNALDIGSAAVLVSSTGAAIIGGIIFWNHLQPLLR